MYVRWFAVGSDDPARARWRRSRAAAQSESRARDITSGKCGKLGTRSRSESACARGCPSAREKATHPAPCRARSQQRRRAPSCRLQDTYSMIAPSADRVTLRIRPLGSDAGHELRRPSCATTLMRRRMRVHMCPHVQRVKSPQRGTVRGSAGRAMTVPLGDPSSRVRGFTRRTD
jgi:hypothetical protein